MERAGDLTNRGVEDPKGSSQVQTDIERMKGRRKPADDEYASRIETAKGLVPPRTDTHCGHCYGEGRDAAIRVIEGALGT